MPLRRLSESKFRLVVTIWIFAYTFFGGWAYLQNRDRSIEGRQAHDALCVEKFSKQRRYNDTAAILREVRKGPIFGFPRDLVIRGQNNLRADLNSLSYLKCTPPPKPKKEGK